MSLVSKISNYIPEVTGPEKKLSFNDKLKWTGLVLLMYFDYLKRINERFNQ